MLRGGHLMFTANFSSVITTHTQQHNHLKSHLQMNICMVITLHNFIKYSLEKTRITPDAIAYIIHTHTT